MFLFFLADYTTTQRQVSAVSKLLFGGMKYRHEKLLVAREGLLLGNPLIIALMNNDIFDSELQKTFLLKMSLTYSPGVFPVLFLKTRLK